MLFILIGKIRRFMMTLTLIEIVLCVLLAGSIGGNVYLGATKNTTVKNYSRVEQNVDSYTMSGARSEAVNITMLDNKVKWAGMFYTNKVFKEYKGAVLFRSTLANWQKGFTMITPVFSGKSKRFYDSVEYDLFYPVNLSETNYSVTLISNYVSITNIGDTNDVDGFSEFTNAVWDG